MKLATRKSLFRLVAAFCALWIFTPLFAADKQSTVLNIKTGPPPGFDTLDTPRETGVDVYYGGVQLGNFRAVFTSSKIAFAEPEAILSKVPSIKFDATAGIRDAISGDIANNENLLCNSKPTKNCGILNPPIAGIIFNEKNFRADLFINPLFLENQDSQSDKILPPSTTGFSAIHNLNGALTRDSNNQQNYSLVDNSVLAYGQERLNFTGDRTQDGSQVSTFAASMDRWGLDNKAGFFNSNPMQLIPQVPMAGVSVGTSTETNLSLREAPGNKIILFLPQRSFVSLVYNNAVYSTALYEAGNQIIDTKALPDGAYNLTIRIRDLNGIQTEETRFFAKIFDIPPEDTPIYFGQVGGARKLEQTSTLPGIGSDFIGRAGTSQRLNDNMGITGNAMAIGSNIFSEAGMFFLFPPNHQLRTTGLVSSQGDFGFGANYLGYMYDNKLSISANLRSIYAGKNNLNSTTTNSDTDKVPDPITFSSQDISGTGYYNFNNGIGAGLQASYSKATSAIKKYAYGPVLRWDFWRNNASSLTLSANTNETQDGLAHSIYLMYSKRIGKWSSDSDVGLQNNGNKLASNSEQQALDSRFSWNDSALPSDRTIAGVEAHHTNDRNTYIADYEHDGDLGNIRLAGTQNQSLTHDSDSSNVTSTTNNSANSRFYTGNFNFSIAHDTDTVTWGGNQQNGSGLILSTKGTSQGVLMKVLVNDNEAIRFKTGETETLFLSPYETYSIRILPVESSSIDYDGSVKRITLYPGNMAPMVWDINTVKVVVGQVQLPDGTPVANATLLEARNLTNTDELGNFQAELLEYTSITFRREEVKILYRSSASSDDFAQPPVSHGTSVMDSETQKAALADLFGGTETNSNNQSPPTVPPSLDTPAVSVLSATLPSSTPIPAIHCRVNSMPEGNEINGVIIYNTPITCTPYTPEEKEVHMDDTKDKTDATDTNGAKAEALPALPAPVSEADISAPVKTDDYTPITQPADSAKVAAIVAQTLPPEPKAPEPEAGHADIQKENISVQFGAYKTREEANKMWEEIYSKFDDLAGMDPIIMPVDLGKKGTWYRLRSGDFANEASAKAFCAPLLAREQDCMVTPNTLVITTPETKPKAELDDESERKIAAVTKVVMDSLTPLPPAVLPTPNLAKEEPPTGPEIKTVVKPAPVLAGIDAHNNGGIIEGAYAVPPPEMTGQLVVSETSPPPVQSMASLMPSSGGPAPASEAAPVKLEPQIAAINNGYDIQLGAYRSEQEASAQWSRIAAKQSLLADKTPSIMRADLGEKGIFYRLRTGGYASMADAKNACQQLTANGQPCLIPQDSGLHAVMSSNPAPQAPANTDGIMQIDTVKEPEILLASSDNLPKPPTPPAPTSELFAIQLGTYRNENEAKTEWENIRHESDELNGKAPLMSMVKEQDESRWRIRVIGFDSLDQTQGLCEKLNALGHNCIALQ